MIKKIYGGISILLFIAGITILAIIDKTQNIKLSLTIQILLILYLTKITWGCFLYIKDQYQKKKYSYSIIMNLGLCIFLIINIIRQIGLVIVDWNLVSINILYNNTLNSFSYFAYLILPLIIIIAVYSILTNIFLIKKEGFRAQNLLGIIFGIVIILGALSSQYIYEISRHIVFFNKYAHFKKYIDIGLNSILCYFYCITLATLYCNIMAARHRPELDKDFIIILGARIRKDGTPTPILKARIDRAIEFAKEQKEKEGKRIIFVPSGGKGNDEVIAEASSMKNYLIQNGISEDDIVIEDKSVNTIQNMKFSKQKIDEIDSNGKIIFSTTNYHVFRSGVIANNQGIDCEGIGCKTKWYFYTNALIREFIANLFSQKKQHFTLITIINIVIFLLVWTGYKYNLI